MKQPAAFRGSYSDWRLVKTRGVVQVIFEIPLADSDAAYEVLGGMPDNSKERWFGIAAIQTPAQQKEAPRNVPSGSPPSTRPDGTKRMDWRDVQPAAQAALRCDQPAFQAFLREEYGQAYIDSTEQAAKYVREFCAVKSRSELGTNHKARVIWKYLDDQFQAWRALERVGA